MSQIEDLLRAHLHGIRETIDEAVKRADALEALVGRLSMQLTDERPLASPVARSKLDGWSEEEDAVLRENYSLIGAAGCARLLPHRTAMAIRVRASRKLHLTCSPAHSKTWCDQCQSRVNSEQIASCQSRFCAQKAAAA